MIAEGNTVMEWNTRLNQLLGCKYPIMQAALHGLGTWEFAAAVSEAGADGCITASVYKTPENLREAIRKMRSTTKNTFTVNISIGMVPNIDDLFEVCFNEEVSCIETSVFRPDAYAERIKKWGGKWIHKGATVDFIKHAEKLGADAVVLVGLDGYGFKNIRQLPTFTSICWAKRQIKVPLIMAGGIGDGRSMAAALAAGADGVYVGSAIMATEECRLSDRIKRNMVNARPDHPDLIMEMLAPPNPEEYKEVLDARKSMPFEKWIPAMERVMLKHDWKDAKPVWDSTIDDMKSVGSRPSGPFSFSVGYIDSIVSVKQFIENMASEAMHIIGDLANQVRG